MHRIWLLESEWDFSFWNWIGHVLLRLLRNGGLISAPLETLFTFRDAKMFMLFYSSVSCCQTPLMAFTDNSTTVQAKKKTPTFKCFYDFFPNSMGQWINSVVQGTGKKLWLYSCFTAHKHELQATAVPGAKTSESESQKWGWIRGAGGVL